VLQCARSCARATGGAYDPVLGTLVELWDVSARVGADDPAGLPLPDPERVAGAVTRCGAHLLDRDERGRYRLSAGASVDLGGIAKGYTADRVRDLCAARGAHAALVSIGSSSIAVLGERPGGGPWRVGLRDVDGGPADRVGAVSLPDGSLSTSGDYERSVEQDGRRVHHVLDPRTGRPSESDLRAVTVLAADGAVAEAWSTAMLVRGLAWSSAACWRNTGLEAVFLTRDALRTTPGLRGRVSGRRAGGREDHPSR